MKHPSYINASNLILITFVLSIIYSFLPGIVIMAGAWPVSVAIRLLTLVLAYLVRKGMNWTKYVLLALAVLGLIILPDSLMTVKEYPLPTLVSLLQVALLIWAAVLLFRIPKADGSKSN